MGNGGLHYPQELRRGADGAMTGFAWPEMLVEVYDLFTAGKVEEAEDLFDIYLPLVRHEVQPGIGLALRKEVLFRCGAIESSEATRAWVVADGDGSHRARLPHCATRAAARGRGTPTQGGGVEEECPTAISSSATPVLLTEDRQIEGDIAVKNGFIAAIEPELKGRGAREIDAGRKFVLPGGIDSHVHVEQKSGMGVMCADDFYTGTVSAAFGGTTTIIPFAAQHRGMSLRKVVQDYHEAATPKAVIDYAFHLIVSDPTPQALGQELPALIKDGYTSFKIYMTYDALKLSDYQILDILTLARREGALVMVHAENSRHHPVAGAAPRRSEPRGAQVPCRRPCPHRRGGSDQPCNLAGSARRRADADRAHVGD